MCAAASPPLARPSFNRASSASSSLRRRANLARPSLNASFSHAHSIEAADRAAVPAAALLTPAPRFCCALCRRPSKLLHVSRAAFSASSSVARFSSDARISASNFSMPVTNVSRCSSTCANLSLNSPSGPASSFAFAAASLARGPKSLAATDAETSLGRALDKAEGETGYGDGDAWGAGDAWGDCEAGSRPEAQRCRAARGELGIGAGDRDCWGDTACLEDVCEAGGLPEAPSCRAPRGELGIGEGDRDSWGDTACLEDVGRREAPCCRDPRGELGDTVRVGLPTSVVE
mmetsp:Transcript_15027/g.52758  ORF Transcript_15027/g.52758 Transcript_15027/m.52758 type:complete len:289 (-) Transcript_15027:199-1065(-)